MSEVIAVIRREYLYRVKNRWFILSTLGLPAFMIAIFAVPLILESRDDARDRALAIIDETGVLAAGVQERLGDGFDVEVASASEREELDRRSEAKEISGYLVLDDETLAAGTTLFRGESRPGTVRRIQIRQAVVESVLAARFGDAENAAAMEALLDGGEIVFENVTGEDAGEDNRERALVVGFGGSFVLYIVILLYGVQVMRSVLEEKTSRIVEVIVSSIEPWQLMLGKILGVGGVGLTQLGIWIAMLGLGLTVGLPYAVALRPELAELENLARFVPAAGSAVLFVAFFVSGFFLFAGMYAAVAAMCSTDEEAQQTQIPVTMLVVAPMILMPMVVEDPNSTLSTVLSLVPFFSPIVMFPRHMAGAPLWQVGLSLVLMALTIWAVAWVAGRIYRVGILMQGKRPTAPELIRWVREA